jgi:nicotinamide-nucleotide amidase
MVPKSAKVIRNKNGTAPGMWFEKEGKIFVSMPGVPYEMTAMMDEYVISNVKEFFKGRIDSVLKYRTILTTGIGESTLFEKVGDLKEKLGEGKLAYLPSASGVRMRVEVIAKSEEEAESRLNELEKIIREKAGEYVYGTGDAKPEELVGEELKKRALTLSIAESCTGGRISSAIVSVAGSSEYYMGGVCSYSYDAKVGLLGINREMLEKQGAVSEEIAIQMAEGVRKRFNTDISLAATGIAGPGGGMPGKPVGMVWIGYSDKNKTYAKKFIFGNDRGRNIERTAVTALEILRRELSKMD